MKTIDLFNYNEPPKVKAKALVYSDLNIHQKINFRANQGLFYSTVYKSKFYQNTWPLLNLSHQRPVVINTLHKDYLIHYKLNSGASNRLDNYLATRKTTLF